MVKLYDCLFVTSGILNALALLYGVAFMLSRCVYSRYKAKAVLGEQMETSKDVSSKEHTMAKAMINIFVSTLLVSIGVYTTLTSKVCFNPFFAYSSSIALVISFLLATSVFNVITTLLTQELRLDNIHEIPMYLMMSLVSVTILVIKEGAIIGVVCLLMFGSVFSDELLKVRRIFQTRSKTRIERRAVFLHFVIHPLCNFFTPAFILFASMWYSKLSLFQMKKASIIVCFFGLTVLTICNVLRLCFAWKGIVREAKKVDDSKNAANNIGGDEEWNTSNIYVALLPDAKKKQGSKVAKHPNASVDSAIKKTKSNFENKVDLKKIANNEYRLKEKSIDINIDTVF